MGLLDELGKVVGGTAAGKVADLVDDLWESRKQVLATVGYVRDNGDDLLTMARWVRDNGDDLLAMARWVQDHGDDLARLLQQLPTLLGQASDGMDTAGRAVRAAAAFLTGDGDGVSVRDVSELAAGALARAEAQIRATASMFTTLGDQFDALPLMDRPAAKIREGARSVGGFATEMTELARKLAQLGSKVTDAGFDLGGMGDGLVASAAALASLPGRAPVPTTTVPVDVAVPTRPASKKAAASKAPAKKAAVASPTEKTPAKKTPAKKTPAKKASARKAPAKRPAVATPAKKALAKKPPAKKAPASGTSSVRRRSTR